MKRKEGLSSTYNTEEVVGRHQELTGKIKLGTTWYGRTTVLFEVLTIATVDHATWQRHIELEQHVEKREWIRA